MEWSKHVAEMIKSVNKRIYFIIQLKRAKVPAKEIINFYCTCVRSVFEYSCEVFHFSLPIHLSDAIEQLQRRVISIIFAKVFAKVRTYSSQWTAIQDLLKTIQSTHHKLWSFMPHRYSSDLEPWKSPQFQLPKIKTNRWLNTYIPACIKEFS